MRWPASTPTSTAGVRRARPTSSRSATTPPPPPSCWTAKASTGSRPPSSARAVRWSKDFLSSYTNYYTVNGAVIAPQFGDRYADGVAYAILQAEYPDRRIVQLDIDAVASGGGGIHCATQSQPAVPPAG
ncbi:agmatine deiminase family protein [Kitasatospora sp. NPDC052868]|uniref:agmatine deiminase family protein n=1 Tax=Kitasatospora sp. NPDC052868 TaxID=3364060 RepID=UPI0037C9A5B0